MPTINSSVAWLVVALLAINACASLAAPVLDSGNLAGMKEQDNNEKQSLDGGKAPLASTGWQSKTSDSAEKLKRGLTNFMNQLNPAPFFIPVLPQQHTNNDPKLTAKASASNGSQSSSKPVAIVNDDPTAEVLIKRPNRLGQIRPFGPMRFG